VEAIGRRVLADGHTFGRAGDAGRRGLVHTQTSSPSDGLASARPGRNQRIWRKPHGGQLEVIFKLFFLFNFLLFLICSPFFNHFIIF
jgi:hypothetical protein